MLYVGERELFMYVWCPEILTKEVLNYLEKNKKRFNEELSLLHEIHNATLRPVADAIIEKIMNKIRFSKKSEKCSDFEDSM